MYCSWFGLSRPLFLHANIAHTRISRYEELSALLLTSLQHDGIVWLYGPSGCGKTTLLTTCTSAIPGSIHIVASASLTPHECAYALTGQQLGATELASHYMFEASLNQRIVIIIDDAHLLTSEMGLWLQAFTAALQQFKAQVSILMAGGTRKASALAGIDARIHSRIYIPALSFNESLEFIEREERHNLAISPIFSRQAIRYLWSESKGYPRELILLADRALHSAAMRGKKQVTRLDCAYANFDISGKSPFSYIRNRLMTICFIVIFIVSFLFTPVLLHLFPSLDINKTIAQNAENKTLELLFSHSATQSDAIAEHFRIWGYTDRDKFSGCHAAQMIQTQCSQGKSSLDEMIKKNLPWIATLTARGNLLKVQVVRAGSASIDFIAGDKTWTASSEWFKNHWSGEYLMLIPSSPSGRTSVDIRSGSTDKKWLSDLFSRLNTNPKKSKKTKKMDLKDTTSQFQKENGLTVSGIADQQTLSALYQKLGLAPELLK
jgi:Type II secretory pathway, component ExeA (predicted ATPase)